MVDYKNGDNYYSVSASMGGNNDGHILRSASILPSMLLGNDRQPVMGYARDTMTRELALPENGLVYVAMNEARHSLVEKGAVAQVYTKALAGCIGVAGVAQTKNGALAGVSHFDALVNRFQRNGGGCASEQFMYAFTAMARGQGAVAIQLLVAYDELSKTAPEYGQRFGKYNSWYYLDQLETAANNIGTDVDVSFNPYKTGSSHSLAANVLPSSEVSIDFQ